MVKIFLILEEDVFVLVLGVPLEETLCSVGRISFKGVRRYEERRPTRCNN